MSKKVNKTQDLFSVMEFEDNSVVEKSNEKILVDEKENLISEEKIFDNKIENNSDKMENK